jgi:N-acetylneuraminate synthase
VRGVYAASDLPAGHRLGDGDFTLAVPLLKGQLSCRELIAGEALARPIAAGEPLTIDHLDNPYSRTASLGDLIRRRGIDPQ